MTQMRLKEQKNDTQMLGFDIKVLVITLNYYFNIHQPHSSRNINQEATPPNMMTMHILKSIAIGMTLFSSVEAFPNCNPANKYQNLSALVKYKLTLGGVPYAFSPQPSWIEQIIIRCNLTDFKIGSFCSRSIQLNMRLYLLDIDVQPIGNQICVLGPSSFHFDCP